MTTPHYLRFARALALATTIGGSTGCGTTSPEPVDSGTTTVADAGTTVVDAGEPTDAGLPPPPPTTTPDAGLQADAGTSVACSDCDCTSTPQGTKPSCFDVGAYDCCAAVGPLPPPELLS